MTTAEDRPPAAANGALLTEDPLWWDAEQKQYRTACSDSLGRDKLAERIAEVIQRLTPPFTVAVYGGWGEGKTHFMKSVELLLQKAGGGSPVHTVWFDLWQHQQDVNPVAAMLQTARERRLEDKNWEQIKAKVGAVLVPLLWTTADLLPSVGWGGAPGLTVKVDAAGAGSAWKRHREDRRQARMEAQDDQVRLHDLFRQALDALAGEGKVVFFIDDLDRCLPDQVVELLEKIRLFMNHDKCVFVIGVDASAVTQAIKTGKKYQDEQVAERYLEKMIQYAFDLPPVERSLRLKFIEQQVRQAIGEDELTAEQVTKIVDGVWRLAFDDPQVDASIRLLRRTVNTFAVDHIIGAKELGTRYDPTIMAVLSVIKACYREPFERLRRRHDDRTGQLWRRLFSYEEGDDQFLGSFFRREGDRWAGKPDGKEPEGPERLGWGFVQACQAAKVKGAGEAGFPDLVEAHFRLAEALRSDRLGEKAGDSDVSRERAEAGPDPADKPGRGVTDHDKQETALGVAEQSVDRDPLVVERITRLPGLVEYFTRPISTGPEIEAACGLIREAAQSESLGPDFLVELSGISWRVLKADLAGHGGPQALLLADRVIGTGPFNMARTSVTWDRCDLRRWLNGEFFESLGEDLGRAIVTTQNVKPSNPVWDIDGGRPTSDKVFLLSMEEAAGYLTGQWDVKWKKYQTGGWFGASKGFEGLVAADEAGESAWWWLRSPGSDTGRVALVGYGGDFGASGSNVSASSGGVRPAFTLNLESERR